MMELAITPLGNQSTANAKLAVSETVFGCDYREALIHQVVIAYRAAGRAGTKAQKSRSDVSGGGAKPWRQKGTGRARAGTTRGPLWRTGGVTFAARPRDFSQKINKKAYRAAMRSILSELVRQDRLLIVEEFTVAAPKTREALEQFKSLALSAALVVTDTVPDTLRLAVRNLPHFSVISAKELNPLSLVSSEKVLMTAAAIKQIEAWLA